MFDYNYIILTSTLGFIGGWLSHWLFESIFLTVSYDDDDITDDNNIDGDDIDDTVHEKIPSSDLQKDKEFLVALTKKQTDNISLLCGHLIDGRGTSNENVRGTSGESTTNGDTSSIQSISVNTLNADINTPNVDNVRTIQIENIDTTNPEPLPEEDELVKIFEEEHKSNSKTTQKNIDDGKQLGSAFHTIPGGGYLTLNQIENNNVKFCNKNKLKRADELEIMHTFDDIRGMNYHGARGVVRERGFELYPVYINRGKKNPKPLYSDTVLGVSIEDHSYDFYKGALSSNAVVTCIVDVGGQDSENRGAPPKI